MTINLIQGIFQPQDGLEIITELINTKVKYHEEKINSSTNEEDIKFREQKIIQLQNSLKSFRSFHDQAPKQYELECIINIH